MSRTLASSSISVPASAGVRTLPEPGGSSGGAAEKFGGEGGRAVAPAEIPEQKERETAADDEEPGGEGGIEIELLGGDGFLFGLDISQVVGALPGLNGLGDDAVGKLDADFPFGVGGKGAAGELDGAAVNDLCAAGLDAVGIGGGENLVGGKLAGQMDGDGATLESDRRGRLR